MEQRNQTSRRTVAWAVSFAAHAGVLAALFWAASRPPPERPLDPDRLVFVEPAPPPPPPPAVELARAEPKAAEPVPMKDQLVEVPHTPKRVRTPRPTPTAAPPRAEAAVAEGEKAKAPAGVEGGVTGGQEGGKLGGVVGGHGDDLVRAELAAVAPAVLARVTPEYPSSARAQRIEGQVLLRAIVDRDGRVEQPVVVVRSVPGLDDAAVTALQQWKFVPGRDHDGRMVRVQIEVPMRFQLQQR